MPYKSKKKFNAIPYPSIAMKYDPYVPYGGYDDDAGRSAPMKCKKCRATVHWRLKRNGIDMCPNCLEILIAKVKFDELMK